MNFAEDYRLKVSAKFLIICITFFVSIILILDRPTAAYATVEFKLAWDANTEADLDGYEIYYRTSNSDYELLGDFYLDELTDPADPMVTITDLYNGVQPDSSNPVVNVPALAMEDGEIYYFALTAFDVQGNTSDFSEELCLEVTGSSVAECRSLNSSDDSGGGGGGGCFISTTNYNLNKKMLSRKFLVMFSFAILILVAFGLRYRKF